MKGYGAVMYLAEAFATFAACFRPSQHMQRDRDIKAMKIRSCKVKWYCWKLGVMLEVWRLSRNTNAETTRR